ncbi:MAG TPA: TIGR00730 family Rossman fold protein [Bryobacteraceae bacterium]
MAKRICVFCGSSLGARAAYREAAVATGRVLASRGIGVVFGGSHLGLMGAVAQAALDAGGEVTGVIPQALVAKEVADTRLADLRVVGSMHERKALMAELADGFIALPGGFGTFEEFCEILTWAQLGFHGKPCGLLNVEGYYDSLLGMFDHAVREGFVKAAHREMVLCEREPGALVERMLTFAAPRAEKWIGREET